MQLGLDDILTKLHHNHSSIDDILRQHPEPHHRAPLLAELCRTVLPGASVHACILRDEDQVFGWVLDEHGNHRPEWAEQLQQELSRPRDPKDAEPVIVDSQKVAVEAIRVRDETHGLLAVGLPSDGDANVTIAARTLLALCSRQLALYLQLEREEQARRDCETERESMTWMANLGELASPVSHEVNNYLNATLLHVAVLAMQAPENLRHDLAEIRRQGNTIAGLVKQLQQYRRRHQPAAQLIDLNRVLRETVTELSRKPSEAGAGFPIRLQLTPLPGRGLTPPARLADATTVPVTLDLAPELPAVVGLPADLKRLCSFLITNAAGAVVAAGKGAVTVRTEVAGEAVVLHVRDSGPSVSPEHLTHFFEPALHEREGTDSLELAACRNLVRRMQGKIEAQSEPENGLDIVTEFPIPRESIAHKTLVG
jgi:C4-dicarboxylate-specific signal transduction histidine kinase